MVSACAAENNLVLGQYKTEEKSNEITAIPELLNQLYIKGCIVTIDAIRTQKKLRKKSYQEKQIIPYSLFLSPHSHIPSNIGIKDFPRSVRLYSTFGGICGYSSLWTSWSASNSFKVELKVL